MVVGDVKECEPYPLAVRGSNRNINVANTHQNHLVEEFKKRNGTVAENMGEARSSAILVLMPVPGRCNQCYAYCLVVTPPPPTMRLSLHHHQCPHALHSNVSQHMDFRLWTLCEKARCTYHVNALGTIITIRPKHLSCQLPSAKKNAPCAETLFSLSNQPCYCINLY